MALRSTPGNAHRDRRLQLIRAGIVGVGHWGQALVRSVHGRSGPIEFAGGVTRTPSNAAAFSRETGIPITASYDALLADPDIDAVVLATPHSQHVPQIEQAAAAGKHVFVEKPIAMDPVSAARAYRCCAKAGVVLALGHNRRFLPAYREILSLVETRALGQILHVDGNFSAPSACMTGMGVHITDLMIDLIGPACSVTAVSSRQVGDFGMDDTTAALMRFASGSTGTLATLTATSDDWRLQVFGSEGWAEVRAETLLTVSPIEGPRTVTEFDPFDTEKAVLDGFASAIKGGADFPVTARQAIANTALLAAIVTSGASGKTVAIDTPEAAGA